MTPLAILAIAAAYLLGAVPFGLLIGRLKGLDIRQHGSGNIGATNAVRVLGKPLGITTFVLDALKGFVPAFVFPLLVPGGAETSALSILCGVAAILGHTFPLYLRFKGGKGVATSVGVLFGIAPAAGVVAMVTWIVVLLLSRYVSLASIVGSVAAAGSAWYFYPGTLQAPVLSILGLLVVLRHRTNIVRLWKGTEPRTRSGGGEMKKEKDQA